MIKSVIGIGIIAAVSLWAQPNAPTTPDYLCSATPGTLTANDTLPEVFDDSGFTPMFDGSSWKGLWQDCQSGHSQFDRSNGAIWKLDPTQHAIYSTQRSTPQGENGGLLLSKKKYGNYEVRFDIWPSYGDDGGFFNRVAATGACYQTVMDYIQDGSFGGTWGEGGWGNRDFRPTAFNGNDSTLNIPGNTTTLSWTKFTAAMNPISFGCSAGGCTQADWRKVWNLYGWNQVRIKFYGGLTNANQLHMKSWIRRSDSVPWTPLWADSLAHVDPASYIGWQVHYGGRFGGARGNWYRNYSMRYLNDTGAALIGKNGPLVPAPGTTGINRKDNTHYDVRAISNSLQGIIDLDNQITITDARGRLVDKFLNNAGSFNHRLSALASGLLYVDIRTSRGLAHQQLNLTR